ncbi:hypothetical protein [Streptomyces sp. NPDC057302]|uniref:hypothetical protein n=1 Tax=Streptomyces sp. NPDC057302 TaxID=3346094 RepID=UPI00363AA6B4
MKHRPMSVAAALAVTAALLLTACGGGEEDNSKGSDKIEGAETGRAKKSESPSASSAADRPEVKLPSGVKDVYEQWKTGSSDKDAVLSDTASRIDSTNDAIVRGDTGAQGLSFYYKDEALSDVVEWVQKYLDANMSFTGTTRYYAPKVMLSGGKTASVVYCADESKGFNKNRKTGKVDKSSSGESPYVLYNTRLKKNDQGVWQTTDLASQRGEASCKQ